MHLRPNSHDNYPAREYCATLANKALWASPEYEQDQVVRKLGDSSKESLTKGISGMAEHPGLISRRGLLIGAGAAAALGRLGPGVMVGSAAAATPSTTLGGLPVARLAMHVHGSWSEGQLSWAQACESAIAEGLDVLYFTDHNSGPARSIT